MGYRAYTGRLINFLSPFNVQYFPVGILILDEEGNIVDFGKRRILQEMYRSSISYLVDFGESVIMPSFVDTHVHLSHYAIEVEEESLKKWLKVMYKEEEKFSDGEYAKTVTREFFDDLIANGITTVCIQASYFKNATEIAFEEAKELGLRAVIGMVMVDSDPDLPDNLTKTCDKAIQETEELINNWHKPEKGLCYALTPRSGWSCSQDFLKAIKHLRERHPDCYLQTHLGECGWILEEVKRKWNENSDTLYFNKLGLLSSRTIVAHAVYLNDMEKEILQKNSVGISHNPAADEVTLRNEHRYFDLENLMEKGLAIGLGVDEPWKLSAFNVMRKAKEIQNRRGKNFPASLYFYLYTLGGAKVLNLEKICGNFGKGKKGDFIVLDTTKAVRKGGREILDSEKSLLEALLEVGNASFIQKVYIGGKRALGLPEETKNDIQRMSMESIELSSAFRKEILYEYKKIKMDFCQKNLRALIEKFLDHILAGGHENVRFESITEIFHRISWIAGVFYSKELPPEERFVNVFRISPFRNTSSWAKVKMIKEYLHLLIFSPSFGLYEKWRRQGKQRKMIPFFDIFLSPPKISSEVSPEVAEIFPWLPRTVVFLRNKERELPTGATIPYIDISDLISEDKLTSARRKILFVMKSARNKEEEIEQILENLITKTIEKIEVEDKLRNILRELALILDKPGLAEYKPKLLLRTLILLMLHDDEWQYYYYFPAKIIPWEAVGSFAIATREPLPKKFVNIWEFITDIFFTPLTILDREREVLRQALRSAVAAIMARNMSHNIGSHVLAKMGYEHTSRLNISENQILFKYLQQNMDFVALTSTEFPEWTYPACFLKEIMKWFYQQQTLLKFIAHQEGIKGIYNWEKDPSSKENENTLLIRIKIDNEWVVHEDENKICHNPLDKDFQLAIPGGIVGFHGFYIILENIIRNTAKHNWANLSEQKREEAKQLKISVEVDTSLDDVVKFKIYDNLSETENDSLRVNCEEEYLSLHQSINCKLIRSFIDGTGKLKKENWGLMEMKISSGFLQEKSILKIGAEGKKILDIIKATPYKDNTKYRLCYDFEVLKPKEVGIIGKINDNNIEHKLIDSNAEKSGIYYGPKDFDFEFLVLIDDRENEILQKLLPSNKDRDYEIEKLPFRLFVITNNANFGSQIIKEPFNNRVVTISFEEFKEALDNDLSTFKLFLYEKWLKKLCKLNGLSLGGIKLFLKGIFEQSGGNNLIDYEMFKDNEELIIGICVKYYLRDKCKDFFDDVSNNPNVKKGNKKPLEALKNNLNDNTRDIIIHEILTHFYKHLISKDNLPVLFKQVKKSNLYGEFPFKIVDSINNSNREKTICFERHEVRSGCLYYEGISGSSTHCGMLTNLPDEEYSRKKILYGVVENALLNILIVDERIIDFLKDKSNNNIKNRFKYSNIFVPLSTFCEGDSVKFTFGNYTYRVGEGENYSEIDFTTELREDNKKVNMLVIHQGIIDKFKNSENKRIDPEEFVKEVKKNIPFVIVTSGRGEPENIPKNSKFVPFSTLESFIFKDYHEKFLLSRIIMSLKARGEEGK